MRASIIPAAIVAIAIQIPDNIAYAPTVSPEKQREIGENAKHIFSRHGGIVGYSQRKRQLLIRQSLGGSPDAYLLMAASMKIAGLTVKVDGPCYSACAGAISMLGNSACFTTGGSWGVHTIAHFNAAGEIMEHSNPTLRSDLMEWVNQNGGFPKGRAIEDMLVMRAPETFEHFRRCE